jgi:hypothetical protein
VCDVTTPPLAFGVFMQGDGGKGFVVVPLGHDSPLCADAAPFLDKRDAAEKFGLHIEAKEAVHNCATEVMGSSA